MSLSKSLHSRQTDRQTDGQTDRQTLNFNSSHTVRAYVTMSQALEELRNNPPEEIPCFIGGDQIRTGAIKNQVAVSALSVSTTKCSCF